MKSPKERELRKPSRPFQKGYTLVELMIVVTVIMVLSTIGMFVYQRAVAYAKETVCKTNLKALSDSILFYLKDHEVFPASLGQLKLRHFQKGYAKALEEGGFRATFSFFVLRADAANQAHAQFLTYENLREYGVAKDVFTCPADRDGGHSYGINGNLAGKAWSEIPADAIIVGDCNHPVFYTLEDLSERHRNNALVINTAGMIGKVTNGELSKWEQIRKLVQDKAGITPPGLKDK